MKRRKLDAVLIWDRANTHYYTGFRGSASVICLLPDQGYFLTDFRYIETARATIRHLEVLQTGTPPHVRLAKVIQKHRVKVIGFEESVPYKQYHTWCKNLGSVELIESTPLIAGPRQIKSAGEQRWMVEAQRTVERSLERVLQKCRPGATERELARDLLHAFEEEGAEGPSFEPIVASGPNSALPHVRPTDRKICAGDFVIFDLGVFVDGYASDMTRTVVVGRPTDRQRKIYGIVLEAQRRAIAKVRNGVAAKDVDAAARSWIEKKGYGKRFGHGTGHGVGLEIHEGPSVRATSEDALRTGMVVTIEPGIYIPGWGGVRIEDMVAVTRTGCKVLSSFPKRLIECPYQ
jgi:Xaa-Pro aminopeptidase